MIQRIRVKAKVGTAAYSLIRPRQGGEIDEYDLLIEAMCHQAAKDLKGKNLYWKFDAMDFFRSEWFTYLTDLDGEEVIDRLLGG